MVNKNSKEKAFTLAEVLITLGIIGIVAALTLPALIQNYRKQEVTTRLKKYNSMMSQAFLLSEVENGKVSGWDASDPKKFFDNYLSQYIKNIGSEEVPEFDNHQTWYKVIFADGSVSYNYAPINGAECVDFMFDVNGEKNPNKGGIDRFRFIYCTDSSRNYGKPDSWSSFYRRNETNIETRLQRCKNNGYECSGYLEMNNWEIDRNYPYKL